MRHRSVTIVGLALSSLGVNPVVDCLPKANGQCETIELFSRDAQSGGEFGASLAFRRDILALGAPEEGGVGAVHVRRERQGAWETEQVLRASDGAAGDQFGIAVAVGADFIAVGARLADAVGENSGAVYVFQFENGVWVEEAKLLAPDGQAHDHFGHSVAAHGYKIAVGARLDDEKAHNAGAVHLYRRETNGWEHRVKFTASDAQAEDAFGFSISLDIEGDNVDLLAVGAKGRNGETGAAYVYRHTAGLWVEEAVELPSGLGAGDLFGSAVSIDDGVLVVGARAAHSGGNRSGAAFVMTRGQRANWNVHTELRSSDLQPFDRFGYSVAVRGRLVVVGAVLDDIGGHASGSAYVFERVVTGNDSEYVEIGKFWNESSADFDHFGAAVGLEGDRLVAGAPFHDAMGGDAGAAQVFFLPTAAAGWSNYGTGWPGTRGVPQLAPLQAPSMGKPFDLRIENSSGQLFPGILLMGLGDGQFSTQLGGDILVDFFVVDPFQFRNTTELVQHYVVPCDEILDGLDVYLQVLQFDEGASHDVSFTPGLHVVIGR